MELEYLGTKSLGIARQWGASTKFLNLLRHCPYHQNRFWNRSELHQKVKWFSNHRCKNINNGLVSSLNWTLIASTMKLLAHVHNWNTRHGEAHRICILVCILDMNSAARRLQLVIKTMHRISF